MKVKMAYDCRLKGLFLILLAMALVVPRCCLATDLLTYQPDRRLYIVDCVGTLLNVELSPPNAVTSIALDERLPSRFHGTKDTCLVNRPSFNGDTLSFDALAQERSDPDYSLFVGIRMNAPDWQIHFTSKEHRAPRWIDIRARFEKSLRSGQADVLLPYTHGGGRLIFVNAIETIGSIAIGRLDISDKNRTEIASIDLATGQVRLIADAPPAFPKNIHLSADGRRVLVEEIKFDSRSPMRAAANRTGRLVEYDRRTSQAIGEFNIPLLSDSGRRIICFSESGSFVIGSTMEQVLWIVSPAGTTRLQVPTDVSSRCGFSH